MSERTGRCMCGAVSFTVGKTASELGTCHCSMCRRWAAGPMIAIEASDFVWSGEEAIKTYVSSDWAERAFCGTCGSSLYYKLTLGDTPQIHLSAGLLDDLSDLILTHEVFYDHKPASYAFAGDTRKKTEAEIFAAAMASTETGDAQ